MAKKLMSMVLAASCLVWCAVAVAQPPAGGPNPGSPGFVPNLGGSPVGFDPPVVPQSNPTVSVANETAFQGPSVHFGFDYLLWSMRRQALPPLITTGSLRDPIPGALGQPNTRVILSGSDGEDRLHSGGRLTFAIQLDPDLTVDFRGFLLQDTTGRKVLSSAGAPGTSVLARPFLNVNAGVEDADPVAVPNAMAGTFTVAMPRSFYGVDANLRYIYLNDLSQSSRITFLTGVRFLQLDEKLVISEALRDLPGLGAVGNSYSLAETFSTNNSFYGGQFGLEYEWSLGPVSVGLTNTVAVGTTNQVQTNSATTKFTEPNGVVTVGVNRALLIQPSNAGQRGRNVFSVVPETTLKLGFDLNEHIRFGVGYNFLYWSGVARPANQIDRAINIQALQPFDQIGPARPAPLFTSSGFWAQGLNVNLGFTF